MTKKRGYIRGGRIEDKRDFLVRECGLKSRADIIVVEQPDKNKTNKHNWRTDHPEKRQLLDMARSGDEIYVAQLSDLAKTPNDMMEVVALFSEKGVRIFAGPDKREYTIPKDSAGLVAEFMVEFKAAFNSKKTEKARKSQRRSQKKSGRRNYLGEVLKKRHPKVYEEVKAVWSDPVLSRKSALDVILGLLPGKGKTSLTSLQNEFGNKTDADGTAKNN